MRVPIATRVAEIYFNKATPWRPPSTHPSVSGDDLLNFTWTEKRLLITAGYPSSSLPYVGWLSDSTRTAMVFEYCSRGSLQDVLIMDDIKLDWSFRLSLLTDLVRVRHFNRIIIFIFIRPQPKLDP